MKKKLGKFIGVVCTLIVIALFIGNITGAVTIIIDPSLINLESIKSSVVQSPKANTTKTELPTDTIDEAERAFAQIDKQLWSSIVKKDQKSINQLISGLNKSDQQTALDLFSSFQKDAPSLTKTYTHIICEANGYYWGEAIHYLTTRNGSKTDESDISYRVSIHKKDGIWKIASSDSDTETALSEALYRNYPQELVDAAYANRNASFFGNFFWLNDRGVYEDVITSNCIYAWQNQDGSVDVGVCIANGEKTIHHITKCTVTLKDNKLGQILKATESLDLQVLPGTREIVTIHVKSSKVRKGTWTTMTSSTNIQY